MQTTYHLLIIYFANIEKRMNFDYNSYFSFPDSSKKYAVNILNNF